LSSEGVFFDAVRGQRGDAELFYFYGHHRDIVVGLFGLDELVQAKVFKKIIKILSLYSESDMDK